VRGSDSDGRVTRRRAIAGGVAGVLVVVAVVTGYVAFARGSHHDRPGFTSRRSAPTTSPAPAPTVTTLPPGVTEVAQAKVPLVAIFDDPSAATPSKTLANPWLLNGEADKQIQQVFLIEEKRDNWLRVLLPERPNGSRGWVRASEVDVVQNPYHIEISIGAHRITVFNSTMLLYQGPVATGAPGTPTPSGRYYIRVLLQTTDPRSVYGPYAYGLSAHSDVLTAFNGGDAEVGIHGNNDASVLGRDVTHGCVRMDNDEITALSKLLPLGTPVDIKP
jgi:lipoprotein-anchoring transpeptidase ErfK/SrfK